ncbi:MAG: hypothetical protein HY343_13245 [Lentisphaerae bacterium]|nr:hypothetical protein [Lentisphaerota bacterium]
MTRTRTIDVGAEKQLFIDNKWFQAQRGMTLTVNPPIKSDIVLRPGAPWDELAICVYSTVLEHEGTYKMWYDGVSNLDAANNHYRCLCYAESKDGLNWKRVNVNLFEWEGIRENNIVMPGANGGVMLDPNGPDEHRFKALCIVKENPVWPESKGAICGPRGNVWRFELYLCTSPDGIHWKRHATPVSDYFHDTQNHFFYDTRIRKYAAYFRTHQRGRTVGRLEIADPMNLPWVPVDPDCSVDAFATSKGHLYPTAITTDESDPPDSDLYTPCVHLYPWAADAYFSFTTPYRHYPVGDTSDTTLEGRDTRGRFTNDGPIDVQLAVSRDGVVFHRPDRRPYVSLGLKGDWDGGQTYMCLGMIRKGNEIWMFDSPSYHTHGVYEPGKMKPERGLRRLVQRLDGFISADAAYEGAEFTTPLLVFSGAYPKINVDCSALGQVWVEIRDEKNHPLPGYTLAESIDIDRNQIAAPVVWREKDNVGELVGKPVKLHFRLRACKLYAFQFNENP